MGTAVFLFCCGILYKSAIIYIQSNIAPKGVGPKLSCEGMDRNPMKDTEPHVQRLFHGSYQETGMEPQGLAGVGLCVGTELTLALLARIFL